jgi:carbamoyltransferase
MGLAAMGDAGFDLSRFLSARGRDDHQIHDRGIWEAWGHLARDRDDPLHPDHITLAASLQEALESTVIRLIEDGLEGRDSRRLCLAGGVALNCAMNQRIRDHFGLEEIFVQPGAHDAGTSLGAALEAHYLVTGEPVPDTMEHALVGPAYRDEEVRAALAAFGLAHDTPSDLPGEVAQRVAAGQVVCWFQDGMEFGPRALGARSILSDPRSEATADRVNRMKGRQWWRPFGPSILAGTEADWFEQPMDSRFMLFTLPVRPEKRDVIPAVVHVDGTSRPQSVHQRHQPRYHAMISRFHELTGVPMVTNTSFNTAHEPIVCSPADAISSFLQLGADALAIGEHLVDRTQVAPRLRGGV